MPTLPSVSGFLLAADERSKIFWQHRANAEPTFKENVFNDQWLAENHFLINSPTAGRGAAHFLNIYGVRLVLRHYRRGGLVRNFSEQSYLWTGLKRTRAWREFALLCELESLGLPAPQPYACQVSKQGLRYTASLISYFLPGNTLAEKMCTSELPEEQWRRIGRCIRQFHNAGVYHADLNAHNILLNEKNVFLIDFDRAEIDENFSDSRLRKNVARLQRSLIKIVSSGPAFYTDQCWHALESGYKEA